MTVVKNLIYLTLSLICLICISLLILFFTQRSNIEVIAITDCKSDSKLTVYCGFTNPEDMVVLPDKKNLLVSEFGALPPMNPENLPGQISLFNTDTLEIKPINISLGDKEWGHANCTRSDSIFSPHGIDLIQRNDGRYQLAVVNHMPRETVEMFELTDVQNTWSLIWKGCIDAPELGYFNDVALKKDGTFYVSHMYNRDKSLLWLVYATYVTIDTGFVYQWDADRGYQKVSGTEGSYPNGVELSLDENYLFTNYILNRKTSKLDLASGTVIQEHFGVGMPDNLTIDGEFIWVATQDHTGTDLLLHCGSDDILQCSLPFTIFKLKQSDLSEVAVFSFSNTVMGSVTVAVPDEDRVWLGTFHGDRMASFNID